MAAHKLLYLSIECDSLLFSLLCDNLTATSHNTLTLRNTNTVLTTSAYNILPGSNYKPPKPSIARHPRHPIA